MGALDEAKGGGHGAATKWVGDQILSSCRDLLELAFRSAGCLQTDPPPARKSLQAWFRI